jgi:hypothetical protein
MKYLFPSIPIEKIENIIKHKKAISIEEGIQQLKELTLSETGKKIRNINNEQNNNKNQFINKNNENNNLNSLNINLTKNNNNSNFINPRNFIKKNPKKRNYNSIVMGQDTPPISTLPTTTTQVNTYNNNNTNNTMIHLDINKNKNNNICFFQKINNENEEKEEEEGRRERKNKELKTVDIAAKEILESKNENELKEYLFDQLKLLETKKNIDKKFSQISEQIDNLNKDFFELRKCNNVVSRKLNKEIVEFYQLNKKQKKLEDDICKVKNSILFHEHMGDQYKEGLKQFKKRSEMNK